MSTRSAIGMLTWDGKVKAVYCHWDGYPQGVGRTLRDLYKDVFKVAGLINNNKAISSLGKNVKESKFIESDKWQALTFDTPDAMIEHYKTNWCEYFYLFCDDYWKVSKGGSFRKMRTIKKVK